MKKIEICERLIREIRYWKSTNDISSPSHNASLEELELDLEDIIEDKKIASEITVNLKNILNYVKNY